MNELKLHYFQERAYITNSLRKQKTKNKQRKKQPPLLAFTTFLGKRKKERKRRERKQLIVLGATHTVEGFHGSDVTVIPLARISHEKLRQLVYNKKKNPTTSVHARVCVCVFSGQWYHSCAFISRLAATETRITAHTPHTPRARSQPVTARAEKKPTPKTNKTKKHNNPPHARAHLEPI